MRSGQRGDVPINRQIGLRKQRILREIESGLDTAIRLVELSRAWTGRELLLGGDALVPGRYHLLGSGATKLVSTPRASVVMELGCKARRRLLGDIPSLLTLGGSNQALVVKVAHLQRVQNTHQHMKRHIQAISPPPQTQSHIFTLSGLGLTGDKGCLDGDLLGEDPCVFMVTLVKMHDITRLQPHKTRHIACIQQDVCFPAL